MTLPNGPISSDVRLSTENAAVERYGAFISYRHTNLDRQWAKWLHTTLETYRVPKRLVASGVPDRVGRIFRDEEELPASADLSQRIDEALSVAKFLIVVCSCSTPESRWVNEEVRRFQAQGRSDRVLALLIEGEPDQSFPAALRNFEPLAADVRPKQGESQRAVKKTALLKLLAGLLEVPYDDLRRREEERARRRLSQLATGASLLMLIFLGLSLFAWQQWQRAETELRVARAQNLAAQAQIAYVATPNTEALGTTGPDRGVLLALESLNAYPTVEGDLALRAGLKKLTGPSLEVPIEQNESLVSVGPHGSWILLEAENKQRIFELATKTFRTARPTESTTANAQADAPTAGGEGILARSPKGDLLLIDSQEGLGEWVFASAVIIRTSDRKQLALLPHEWHIQFAAFSQDARWLVTVSGQASLDAEDPSATALVGSVVRVWEVPSGRKITEVSLAHEGGIWQTALSSDGEWLATATATASGRVVVLWPLWPDLLRNEACKRLTRNLSISEWETYLKWQPQRATCSNRPIVSE
jgi:TIR domain-containing protein